MGRHGGGARSNETVYNFLFVTILMCSLIYTVASEFIFSGEKIDGNSNRIFIVDNANALTTSEEDQVIDLLQKVYQKSGMPVTVYTEDFSWREHYSSIEAYSEKLYYEIGLDESSMILLYTTDNSDDFYDFEYDIYRGDDTIACLSDRSFNKLIDNFQKGMTGLKLYDAIEYSFGSVMDELATKFVDPALFPAIALILFACGISYIYQIVNIVKKNAAYKHHKEQLAYQPMALYNKCPNCGAPNSEQKEVCSYCNSLLKIRDKKVKFVSPK